jgi:hypothetical protein
MSDTQLYLAIGIPSMFFAVNLLAILWQARGLERSFTSRIEALQSVMTAKFEAVDVKFDALAARFDVFDAKFEATYEASAPQ